MTEKLTIIERFAKALPSLAMLFGLMTAAGILIYYGFWALMELRDCIPGIIKNLN